MNARDIMSRPSRTCAPNTDLATVAKIMWDHDCGFVPVVADSGAVAGVVTDRDICIATATRRLLPEQLTAADVMTTPSRACRPDDNLGDVLATMRRFQVRRVPVVDGDGRLQGVISLNDIVLAASERREPQASDVVSTMAAICAHRPLATESRAPRPVAAAAREEGADVGRTPAGLGAASSAASRPDGHACRNRSGPLRADRFAASGLTPGT